MKGTEKTTDKELEEALIYIDALHETIKDLLIIANLYWELPNHNKISKNAVGKVIERAKQFVK